MRDIIHLSCTGCKRKNYTTTKNKKKHTEKMEIKKFCPFCKTHIMHKESK